MWMITAGRATGVLSVLAGGTTLRSAAKGSRVPPGTPGTRSDRFQARCFYSGVGETEALNHGSPGRRFAHRRKAFW